jgi:hypothetical protein
MYPYLQALRERFWWCFRLRTKIKSELTCPKKSHEESAEQRNAAANVTDSTKATPALVRMKIAMKAEIDRVVHWPILASLDLTLLRLSGVARVRTQNIETHERNPALDTLQARQTARLNMLSVPSVWKKEKMLYRFDRRLFFLRDVLIQLDILISSSGLYTSPPAKCESTKHTHTHLHTQIYTLTLTHTNTYTHVPTHTLRHVCIHSLSLSPSPSPSSSRSRSHTHTHTHTHTLTHTHNHTHACTIIN